MCTICAQSRRSTCYPVHTNHYYEPVEHICKVAGWSPHPSLLVCHWARSLHSRCSISQLWFPRPSIWYAFSLSRQRFVTYLSSKHFHLFFHCVSSFQWQRPLQGNLKNICCARFRVSFRLSDYVTALVKIAHLQLLLIVRTLVENSMNCEGEMRHRGPCITVTLQGGTSMCVLVRGQCRDKLSILSVTVVGPSGIMGGRARAAGRRTSSLSGITRRREWRTAGHWDTNCNLLPALIWSMKEKQSIKWYTVLENQCLSWHGFTNGQGQSPGSVKWWTGISINEGMTLTSAFYRGLEEQLPKIWRCTIMYESPSPLYLCCQIS